ncbi:hypothetical protein [Herbaspirillum rubrisubalbicans]|uniref:hypothetical protein n=1 Tax=Herbaspirillum rubrisubalbicans TaxID=80842 RepID=UPI0011D21194|nr:hypothetical protein [Herbaspirillum rubrisubalbicans]
MKGTVITPRALEANTTLSFSASNLKPNEALLLQQCSDPCNSAKLIHKWVPVNGEISAEAVTLADSGMYYFWIMKVSDGGAVGPVFGDKVTSENNSVTAHFLSGESVTVVISKPNIGK